jgi:hydrogenase/urease accessory protein HupE
MRDWIVQWIAGARKQIADGNVLYVERRILPFVLLMGIFIGALLARLTILLGIIIAIAFGFAIGYGVRAYMSHRRRVAYLARRN